MFEYSTTEMKAEYDEMLAAKESYEGDPVAQMLVEMEAGARMDLGYKLVQLSKEAEQLADRAQGIVGRIDLQGLNYSPNSLGEIQSHQVDVMCAAVHAARTRVESIQKQLREHLDAK